MSLLEVGALTLSLPGVAGGEPILRGVDFALGEGQRMGLVGRSGSGKSMTALTIMGLQPERARVGGSVRLGGRELVGLDDAAMSAVRGRRMAMIFQEPMTALNPVHPIGRQIAEGAIRHRGSSRREAVLQARALMARVGLDLQRFAPSLYPHQLSGGQRQRVMIAMALACEPELLIADEPTTALDLTTQLQILRLIDEIIRERGMALLLITHDLGVVAGMTEQIAVMQDGRIVEAGTTEAVYSHAAHAETRALFAARPHDADALADGRRTFHR